MAEKELDKKEIYEQEPNGRLNIKNSRKFLELLSGTDHDSYEKLLIFGKKNLNQKATDIPFADQEMIVNFAIVKTMRGFDPNAGANLLTYFTNKLRGEVSDYRNKRNSMLNKIHKLAHSGEEDYLKSFDKETQTTTFEKVELETPEDKLLADDIYRRKLQAFRMAFSGIPLFSQNILNKLVASKQKLYEIAEQENMSVQEVSRIRNYALSLVFVRVLRSRHLDDDEKEEIIREHNLRDLKEEELQEKLDSVEE